MSESFTAVAMCPRCDAVGVHWLDKPNIPGPGIDPCLVRELSDGTRIMAWGRASFWDSPGTVVARVCRDCGHRWGQL